MKSGRDETSILFWGTSEFAIPALSALLAAGFSVAGVVTTPDKPAGRKQLLTPPPVKVLADSRGLLVYQPETLKPVGYELELPDADMYVVAAYGKIIPRAIIERPRLGALNIHPSLLPRWRGPSPIQFTILAGDIETGVTIIQMDELMDHGDIVAVTSYQLPVTKVTYPELHDELARLGAGLLVETLPKWVRGEIVPVPQDHARATFSKMLTKDDGRIDWSRPAREIERMIRAFTPWPGAWTMWPGGDRPRRVRIDEADIFSGSAPPGAPGYAFSEERAPLGVCTGEGALVVQTLTLEGGKSMDADSFVAGHPDVRSSIFV